MVWKKLIPYDDNSIKRLARGLVLDHRAKVVSLANIFSRSLVVKARSHDNSCVSEEELIYTEWMANQDVDLTDDEYQRALEHHYVHNDHHMEHFESVSNMNLQHLSLYLCDVMARVGWETDWKDDEDYMNRIYSILDTEIGIRDKNLCQILKNTFHTMVHYDRAGVRSTYRYEPKAKEE